MEEKKRKAKAAPVAIAAAEVRKREMKTVKEVVGLGVSEEASVVSKERRAVEGFGWLSSCGCWLGNGGPIKECGSVAIEYGCEIQLREELRKVGNGWNGRWLIMETHNESMRENG